MKDLEAIHLETEHLGLHVFPSIVNASIVWSSYAELKVIARVWAVNGGQSHPTREAAVYGLMNELSLYISDFTAAHALLTKQLDREFRKTALTLAPVPSTDPDPVEAAEQALAKRGIPT